MSPLDKVNVKTSRRSCAVRHACVLALLAVSLCVVPVFAQAQAQPSQTPSPEARPSKSSGEKPNTAPAPTGTIKGRVTADDGRALSNAMVMARAINGTAGMKTSQVDSEGRFALNDVPTAVYLILATAPGYIDESIMGDMEHWPRYLIGSQLRIRLIKGGVVTGTVTNSKGQPVVGVPVRATPTKGAAIFMSIPGATGMSETDDRGNYRIYGLPPGQYTVDAGGSAQFSRFASSGFDLDVTTYYPSSTYDTAVPVAVRAGEETAGIDIRYKGTEGHSIIGTLTGKFDSGSAGNAISVFLSHGGSSSVLGISIAGLTEQNRFFSFNGLADGEYDLFAVFATGIIENVAAGSRRVTVRGSDVTGVELSLMPLASLGGVIKLDAIAPELKCDKRGSELMEMLIDLPHDDPKKGGNKILPTMLSGFNASFSANGDFSVRNLEAGTYRLRVKLPTEAWYARAINLPSRRGPQTSTGTADRGSEAGPGSNQTLKAEPPILWQGTVTIKSGEKISGVSILIGQDAAGLRGRITTAPEGTSVSTGLRVHLVPTEREEAGNVLRYFETAVESNGSFAFTNIAPGRYFIVPRLESSRTTEATPRPVAFNAAARTALRREAEAFNNIVELKPCQRMVDVALKLSANQ